MQGAPLAPAPLCICSCCGANQKNGKHFQILDVTPTARLSLAMRPPILRGLKAIPCTFWGSRPQSSVLTVGLRLSRGHGPAVSGLRWYRRKAAAAQPVQPPVKPAEVTLRKYQLECIQAVVESFKQGHKRVGVSLATGGGKTVRANLDTWLKWSMTCLYMILHLIGASTHTL